jgi:3-dehydroquinate synthase
MMETVTIHLKSPPDRTYDILIESGLIRKIGSDLQAHQSGNRYFVVTDTNVADLIGKEFMGLLRAAGIQGDLFAIPAGETSKRWKSVSRITERMTTFGLDRRSAVIALGGGVVGDIAGFAAAIYMRGIPYIQVPTTLLAQIDSSVGGKTGIDTDRGKNLLGAFHQPTKVYIDPNLLRSLPEAEIKNGMAEMIKYAVIKDPELFDTLNRHSSQILRLEASLMTRLIARCCEIKGEVVEKDEKEGGLRRILNFGHTVGHGIEAASDFAIPHGAAVSIGMAAAAKLSRAERLIAEDEAQKIIDLLRQYRLPVEVPPSLEWTRILGHMKSDKKFVDKTPLFVLVKRIGEVFVYDKLGLDRVEAVLSDRH